MTKIRLKNSKRKNLNVPGEQPGTLRHDVTMEIQTMLAQRLIRGRERSEEVNPIVGVIGFGQRTGALWRAAESDDPYADWVLLRIEESLQSIKKSIDSHSKRIGEVLEAMDGFEIDIAQSSEPARIPLQFNNPYGYMVAYLVSDFDKLSCKVLTARHLGLIERQRSDEILREAGRGIRRLLNCAFEWRFTGVNREDIRQQNQNAARAQQQMGNVPADVLSGQKRARMAPQIHSGKNSASPTEGVETPKGSRATESPKSLPH